MLSTRKTKIICTLGPAVGNEDTLRTRIRAGMDAAQIAAELEALAPRIRQCATAWGLGVVWPRRIDEINILQATFEAMTRAICLLSVTPGMIYVDGNKTIPDQTLRARWTAARFPQQEAVVGGDARVDAIAAASVLAKTFRDHVMECLARRWPGYGFEQHKGYGTQAHIRAIREVGSCPIHRRSFITKFWDGRERSSSANT